MYRVPVSFGFFQEDSRFCSEDEFKMDEYPNDEHYTKEQCLILFDYHSDEMMEVEWIKTPEEFQKELDHLNDSTF